MSPHTCFPCVRSVQRRRKKVTKERATLQAASLRFTAGNLRCSRPAGSRSNSLHCVALKQSRALIRWPLRSSAHPEGNPGNEQPTCHRCACGGVLAGWRVCRRTHPLRDLTRRICPNAAAQQRSELCGAPRKHPDAGCPAGAADCGARFFASFLVAHKKGGRPPGRIPASALTQSAETANGASSQQQPRRPQGLALATAPVATNARSAFSRAFKRRSFSNPTRTMIFCPLDRLCSCGSANS